MKLLYCRNAWSNMTMYKVIFLILPNGGWKCLPLQIKIWYRTMLEKVFSQKLMTKTVHIQFNLKHDVKKGVLAWSISCVVLCKVYNFCVDLESKMATITRNLWDYLWKGFKHFLQNYWTVKRNLMILYCVNVFFMLFRN